VTNPEAAAAAKSFNGGRGLDAVIITAATVSSDPVQLAGELCRPRGRVSAVGLVGMDIPRQLYYEKELDFYVSRSYGPGRYDAEYEEKGTDYPFSYVRWTENRNMLEFLRLLAAGMNLAPLITHSFDIAEARRVYELILDARREYFLGVLFEYPQESTVKRKLTFAPPAARSAESDIRLGIIGPGSFARATLLPALRKMPGVTIQGVCSATGRSAQSEAKASGAAYCTTDYREILTDPQINAVLIATRHNLHARMVVDALEAGKNVLVEKPLALQRGELEEVMQAARDHPERLLMVGFNRRFSTHSRRIKTDLTALRPPFMLHYRVNAGYLPPESWVHDPEEGGGRILGEMCHFVDMLQFLTGCDPVRVWAQPVKGNGEAARLRDNVDCTILFADGSVGNILYTSLGPRTLAKESVEVFAGGRAFVLDNFRSVIEYDETAHAHRALSQDKGHAQMLAAFVDALKKGTPSPIALRELYLTSLATFAIVESLETGRPVDLSLPTT
jgi:predicted dehydrogenase